MEVKTAYYPLGAGEEMSEGEYERMWELCNNVGRSYASTSTLVAPMGIWVVRSGARLSISQMTDTHLVNAIAYCKRYGLSAHPKCDELRAEQKRRAR